VTVLRSADCGRDAAAGPLRLLLLLLLLLAVYPGNLIALMGLTWSTEESTSCHVNSTQLLG